MPKDIRDGIVRTPQQAQQAPASVLQARMSGNDRDALLMEARERAEERRLQAQVQTLTDRVALLETALRKLQLCTVQQFPDGRLHLPAGSKLTVAVPGPYRNTTLYHLIDLTRCWVEAPRPMSAQPPSPATSLVIGANQNVPAPRQSGPAGPAAAPLRGASAGPGNGQSVAAANGVENPISGRKTFP